MSNCRKFLKSEVIRAGAGTGKTTKLVNQVFDIYQSYKKEVYKEPAIVLTTFSRKATEELRERLLEIASEKKDYEFLTYLSSEKILITSIDGLCFKFLTKNVANIGYPLVINIMEDKELKKIIKLYLSKNINNKKKYLPLLSTFSFEDLFNITQQFYIAKLSNPKISVATKSVQEIFYIKKAKQLLKLQKKLLSEILMASAIKESFSIFYTGHLNFINHVLSLSDKEKFAQLVDLLVKVKQEFPDMRYSKISGADKKIHKAIMDNIKEVRCVFLTKESSGDKSLWGWNEELHLCLESLLKEIYNQIEAYKKKEGKINLSDLLLLTLKIITQYPHLGLEFSKKWNYWLVDEYQDTSFSQEKVLKALIGDATAIVVGDPQQSIYFFRGSRKEVFEAKEQNAKLNNQLSYLNVNYRSESSLVYFFNDFFKNFKGEFVNCLPYAEPTKTLNNIFFNSFSSKEEELEGVYSYIQGLKKKGVKANDIVILAKQANSLKACALFFKKKELPFYYHGESSFFKLNEIQDLQALLRFLILPEDNINFIYLLRSPWFAMEDQIVADTIEALKKENYYYSYFFKQHSKHPSLIFLHSVVKEFNKLGAVHALNFFINNSTIISSSLFYDPSGRREANIWKFLIRLVQKSRVSNFNILDNGADKLDLDNLDQEAEASPIFLSDQLQMMTIHKSKGLKFDHVILIGLDAKTRKTTDSGANKLFVVDENYNIWTSPFKKDIQKTKAHNMYGQQIMFDQSQSEVEEAERVFYVALTRAAKSIYLSWEQKYKMLQEQKEAKPLDKSSWALVCDNFLVKKNWNTVDILNQEKDIKIFQSKKYNILKNYVDTEANTKTNTKTNTEAILKTPFDENNKKAAMLSDNTNNKKTTSLKLPIFTVSHLVQFLSEQKTSNNPEQKTSNNPEQKTSNNPEQKTQQKTQSNFSIQKSFKNKIEKGIRGTYWHSLLEHLVFLLQNNKDRVTAVKELKSLYALSKNSITEQQLDEVINFLLETSEVPFLEIIKNSFIEWEFQFCFFSRYIVEGKIDLWGWNQDTIWIIDYKFGSSKNTELFFNQLELYAQAISLKFSNKKIQLALLYPLEKKRVIRSFQFIKEKELLLTITSDSFHRTGV